MKGLLCRIKLMNLSYEIWDVFTDKVLTGNPLALIPDASGLSDEQMQAIAKEFNLSETSFVLPSIRADLRARFFTPAKELPMAGHPSIGTIYASYAAGRIAKAEVSLELPIGLVPMKLELEGQDLKRVWMSQGIPELLAEVPDRRAVAKALGIEVEDLVDTLPIQVVSAGNPIMLVPVDSLELLARLRLRLDLLPEDLPANQRSVLAFTFDAPESDLRCRMFAEAMGVIEDPATGSAHGPLGWYLAQHELFEFEQGAFQILSHQGVEMGRPSQVYVRVKKQPEGFSVDVGGQAVKLAEGSLWL